MKKFLCVLLAILMVVSLCACGKDNNNNQTTNPSESTEPSGTQSNVSMGETEDQKYYNSFLKLGCTIPKDWTFHTDEQIREMNNLSMSMLDKELQQMIQNATIIYDMAATNSDSSSNININMEKLNSIALAYGVEKLLERQVESVKTVYKNMGCKNINVTPTKVTVDGQEFYGMKTSATLNGYAINALIFSFIVENYMANVSITSAGVNMVDEVLGWFTVG